MDNQTGQKKVEPQKLQKVTHFFQEIPLPEGSTVVPYKSLHTTTGKKSKKSKKKFEQFSYYRLGEDKSKIMKILFKDDRSYMIHGYYPFTDPISVMEDAQNLSTKNLFKVIKSQAAYIGHIGDELIVKKMAQVKLGNQGTQFDTIGDNFEKIKIANKERFQQFLRILKTHPKAIQISIRVIIDETDIANPVIIDYQFFKREQQLRLSNAQFGQKKQQ